VEIKDRNFFKLFSEAGLSLPHILWSSELNLIITSGNSIFYLDRKKNVENTGTI
jgi:hypothetical protein